MKFLKIKEAIKLAEQQENKTAQVSIRGWVYRERKMKDKSFLVIRDSSGIIQCVVKKDKVSEKEFNDAEKALIESSVEITGEIKEEKRAPEGFEITVTKINVVQFADIYPISKDQSPEWLLDNRHLWIRSRKISTVLKVRATILGAIREFFDSRGYFEFSPPIFTPNACEGGSTLFEVKYFNDVCYLTQSWQLYAEAGIFALENIYTISPCFRAEKSKTSRHLAEFWMAEVESAWIKLDGMVNIAKELIAFIIVRVLEKHEDDLKLLGQNVEKLKKLKLPFPTITYKEALDVLEKKSGMKVEYGKDLRTIEEEELMKHFDVPVVVTNYPKEIMAFYKPEDPTNKGTALCFDMLAPEGYGEIIGGSEREWDVDQLKIALEKEGEKPENYDWYLDLRKYGSVPHSGFGMGVERIIAWICHLDNIKDAIPFPRTMMRKSP